MLLVVVPRTMSLNALEVNRWVDLLKVERERRRRSPEELPILRLSPGESSHRKVLQGLGLDDRSEVRTYTCVRDAKGWPVRILRAHPGETPADAIVAESLEAPAASTVKNDQTVGLLLVGSAENHAMTETFLQELGRFWVARYGRVRPSPYPLASYDLGDSEVATALSSSFPELLDRPPLVALCLFVKDQPREILQVYRALDTPASLVREISAARANALQGAIEPVALPRRAPRAKAVGLSDDQERVLLVSRLQETARQLWGAAQEDQSRHNQAAKRLLLRVVEESRRYLEGDPGAWLLLQESLRDYAVEPFVTDDPRLAEGLARFLHLGKTLLNGP